ncbi:hypothetical protein AC1031_013320 [Aphanomyces cochlioides]|nr:hypothetical protein AC1031_013320 [Aphanomyces cochlioides]
MGKKLHWSSVSSNSIKSTWTSVVYMSPLLGAYMADERWGRFKTIAVFGTVYMLGDVLLAIASHPSVLATNGSTSTSEGLFITDLFVFIGIGTGAITSNVNTLGADQFDPNDEHQGSGAIPKEYGYFATFTICAGAFIFALITFFIGSPRYIKFPPQSQAMSKMVKVLVGSFSRSTAARFSVLGFVAFMLSFIVNLIAVFLKDGSK